MQFMNDVCGNPFRQGLRLLFHFRRKILPKGWIGCDGDSVDRAQIRNREIQFFSNFQNLEKIESVGGEMLEVRICRFQDSEFARTRSFGQKGIDQEEMVIPEDEIKKADAYHRGRENRNPRLVTVSLPYPANSFLNEPRNHEADSVIREDGIAEAEDQDF